MSEVDVPRLGRVAVERGLVSAEQLAEAVGELERRRAAGSQLPLGELLVAMGYITRHQLTFLLEAQGGPRTPAQQIEGYELIRKLGEGGMGAVYLARQLSLDRLVALKVLRRQYSRDPAFVDRFLREARLAGKLDHENVVRAIDVGESGGFHYLAMEYVEGRSLIDLMPPGEALAEPFALQVVLQVARGLEHAHRHGIVHRDIKPDNILIDGKGVSKLADLGLAKQIDATTRLTQTGMVFGTADYMSPEQARGEGTVDTRSDIYSLGATLYHLVTGQPPFSGSNALAVLNKQISEAVPWPADVNPAVSEACGQLIAKMMAKNPDDRYPSPTELIADLERVIAGQSPAAARLEAGRSSLRLSRQAPAERPVPAQPPVHHPRAARFSPGKGTDETRPLSPTSRRPALPVPALLGAAAAFLLAGLAVGFLMRAPGRDAESRREAQFHALYSEAEALRRAGSTEGALAKFERLRTEARNTGWAVLAGKAIDELRSLPGTKGPPGAGGQPETDARLRAVYEAAGQFRSEHPEDYARALERFGQLRAQAAGTQWAGLAAEAMEAVEGARDRAVEAAVAPLRQRAEELAAAGDFDGAMAVFGEPAGTLADVLRPRYEAERRRLTAQAEERLGAALTAAEQSSRNGRPAEGLAELDKLANIKYAAWAGKLSTLRARLEKDKADVKATAERRLKAEAALALSGILDGFAERSLAGDQVGAAKFLAEEKARLNAERLAIVSAELAAAERVAGLLKSEEARRSAELRKLSGRSAELALKNGRKAAGKVLDITDAGIKIEVTLRDGAAEIVQPRLIVFGELAPGEADRLVPRARLEGPDGQLAAAMLLMAAEFGGPSPEDLKRADAALGANRAHPLAAGLSKRLEVLKIDPRERAAGKAWEEAVAKLVRAKYSAAEGQALLAALDAFARDHGGTDFAMARAAEVTKLRLAAGDETEKIRLLFGGQVVRFDAQKLEVELLWDFSSAAQLAGFTALAGKAEVRDGQLVLEPGALLSCRGTFDSRLKVAWEWDQARGGTAGVRIVAGTDAVCVLQSEGVACLAYGSKMLGEIPMRRGMAAGLSGGQLTAEADGKAVLKPVPMPAGGARFELYSLKTASKFDNLRVTGTLDRAWLAGALARLGAGAGTSGAVLGPGSIRWTPATR